VDFGYIAVLAGTTLGSVYYTMLLRKVWWHKTTSLDHRPAWWPAWWLDEQSWRGFVRTIPTSCAFCWILAAVVIVGPFVPVQPRDWFGFIRPAWFSLPGAVSPFVAISLWLSVYLFNRPKFVVPPHMRDDPGALRNGLG